MNPTDVTPAPGVLLIAPPMMPDPNFRRTVILLCDHNDEGSFGLVLNRPLELHLHDVLEDADFYEAPLSLGGPVQPNTLHFLHRYADIPEAIRLADGVLWGGDFEELQTRLRFDSASPEELRFFLGYAGWSAEQLAEEIATGSWILTPADDAHVFDGPPETLWRRTLRRMGGDFAMLANFPDDPRMN